MSNYLPSKNHLSWCFAVLVLLSGTAFAQEKRIWTDSTGRFTVEATLVEIDGENVKLKKTDLRIVTLPLNKLSDVDQFYIRQHQEKTENPFAGGEINGIPIDLPESGLSSRMLVDRMLEMNDPNFPGTMRSEIAIPGRPGFANNVKRIVPGAVTGWHYKPAPLPLDGEKANYKPCMIKSESIGPPDLREIVEGTDAPFALLSQYDLQKDTTMVSLVNMATGTDVSGVLHYRANVWVSPDGSRLMATAGWGTNRLGSIGKGAAQARVEFYTPANRIMIPNGSLVPYGDQISDINKTVTWAAWVTPQHIFTINNSGILRLWDTKTSQAIYEMSLTRHIVVLSKDRKAMLVGTHAGMVICDTMTGETLGILMDEVPQGGEFDFSPDNTRLLGVFGEPRQKDPKLPQAFDNPAIKIVFWDLTTGQQTGELKMGVSWPHRTFWVDNRMFFRNNLLYDSESGMPVCHYTGNFIGTTPFQGLVCYLYLAGFNEYILNSVKLPQQAALDAINNLKPEDRFMLYPGAAVAVDVDVDEAIDADVVRENLEKNLKQAGFILDDSSTIRLTGTVKKREMDDVSYSGSWYPRQSLPSNRRISTSLNVSAVDVQITLYDSAIVLTNDGKEFWKAEMEAVPPQKLDIDKDRSLQQVADELCKPNLNFFAEIMIPRYHTGEVQPQPQPSQSSRLSSTPQNVKVSANLSALINATLTPTGVR